MRFVAFGETFGGPLFVEAALVSDGFGALFCSGMRKAPLNVVSGAIVVDSSGSEELACARTCGVQPKDASSRRISVVQREQSDMPALPRCVGRISGTQPRDHSVQDSRANCGDTHLILLGNWVFRCLTFFGYTATIPW